MIPSDAILELRFQRRIKHLHRLGPRPCAEILAELATLSGRRTWLDQQLEEYSTLTPEVIEALDANDFPALPIYPLGEPGQ